jgi:hypothetical protein
MQWPSVAVWTVLALCVAAPAKAEDEGRSEPGRFSLDLGLGGHLTDGGNLQSVAFGYNPWRGLTLLMNIERNHVPTRVRTYEDGYSVTRGGTLTSLTGEFRYTVPLAQRLFPYALVGRGVGLSEPNVNDRFPTRVTNTADVFYVGGGVRIPIRRHLAVFADSKFLIQINREGEGLGAMMPIRAGVTWRF